MGKCLTPAHDVPYSESCLKFQAFPDRPALKKIILSMAQSNPRAFVERLIKQSLVEFNQYADPANQVEVLIQPITHPVQRIIAILIGTTCVVIGIPLAAALPIVPISPFAAVGLFCFARVSVRFRDWLVRQPVFKIAMTVIYTRHEGPFRLMRAMLNRLAGGQVIYQETHPAQSTNLSLISPTIRAGKV